MPGFPGVCYCPGVFVGFVSALIVGVCAFFSVLGVQVLRDVLDFCKFCALAWEFSFDCGGYVYAVALLPIVSFGPVAVGGFLLSEVALALLVVV